MCLFCTIKKPYIYENDHLFAIYDAYPVTKGHALIISKAHRNDYFAMTKTESDSLHEALHAVKSIIDKQYAPQGYNIGINNGEASGQTIFHLHVHLIPRYTGDMKDPRGGVRGVIPCKQKY